jgi:hypothetical protein
MATAERQVLFIDEVADFLTSKPSREQIVSYHPSSEVEERFELLLEKLRDNSLTLDERDELEQFQQTEILVRLIKARLRSGLAQDS